MERKRTLPSPLKGYPAPSLILDFISSFDRVELPKALELLSVFLDRSFSASSYYKASWDLEGSPSLSLYFKAPIGSWGSMVLDALLQNPLFENADISRRVGITRVSLPANHLGYVLYKDFAKAKGLSMNALYSEGDTGLLSSVTIDTKSRKRGALIYLHEAWLLKDL